MEYLTDKQKALECNVQSTTQHLNDFFLTNTVSYTFVMLILIGSYIIFYA